MKEFLAKPYAARQFLVVERDNVLNMRREALEKLKEENIDKEITDNKEYVKLVKRVLLSMFVPTLVPNAIINAEYLIKMFQKEKALSKKIVPNYMSFEEVLDLKFPIGHPREGCLYIAHPIMKGVYYPFSEFHKKVFEHKFSELNLLLMKLGAKSVEVEYISGWNYGMNSEVNIPKGKGKLEGKIIKKKSIIYKANYADNESRELPKELHWYYFEPTWQSVGEGRINHNLQDFNLIFDYNDDFGVSAEVQESITDIGFGVKGKYESHKNTVWKIRGIF